MGPVSQPVSGDKKLEFKYDYMGRRVEKAVYARDPNTSDWESDPDPRRRFVWSDWLLVLELDATDPNDVTVLRKYTWGLDLAGQSGGSASGRSIDDAGGIGGLLATYDAGSSKDYLYFHDANGNVGQLIDRSDGSIAAKYEYDAYGNNLLDPNDPNESGPYADDNPFRFSTKYFDDETGLYAYVFRYYSPRLGRWLTRDPYDEIAGVLLYCMVGNNAVGLVDPLGLCDYETSIWVGESATRGHIDTVIDVKIKGKCHYCCCDAGVKFVQIVWEEVEYLFTVLAPFGPRRSGQPEMDPHSWYPHVHYMREFYKDGDRAGRLYQMRDSPGVNNYWLIAAIQQDFETCALCAQGGGHDRVAYCVIGCWEWGHKWKRGSPDSHSWYGYPTGLSDEMQDAIEFAMGSDYRSPLSESFDGMCGGGQR